MRTLRGTARKLSSSALADMAALWRAGFGARALAGMDWPGAKGEAVRLTKRAIRGAMERLRRAQEKTCPFPRGVAD